MRSGYTILIIACKGGLTRVCNDIVKRGADVNIQDDSGKTALLHASRDGYYDICTLLTNADNVDLDIQDKKLRTALMEACVEGYFEICQMLIEAGANLELKDKHGKRACDLACGYSLKRHITKSTYWNRRKFFIIFLYENGFHSLLCPNTVNGQPIALTDDSPELSRDRVFRNEDLCREISTWL